MLLLARHLPRPRFEVEFVLLGEPGELADEARAAGARVHSIRSPSRSRVALPLWSLRVVASVWSFVRLVRRGHYDLVDAWLFDAYAMAAVTRPVTRIPVLVSGRRSLSDYKAQFSIVRRLADRVATAWTDAIVANGHAVAENVQLRERLPGDRIRVIRNGVEILPSPEADALQVIRAGWGCDERSLVIGCVANYKPGKGLDLLLDAFAPVAASRPETHLVLIGEGGLRTSLERQIADRGLTGRVTLAGATPDPRPLAFAFDIAVLASEAEGLPNALLEAAAAARPMVATDAGASREIVIHGETGFVTPVGDREAMTTALLRLVDAPDLRAAMGAAALEHARVAFGVERCVAEFAALYEELATRKAARGRR